MKCSDESNSVANNAPEINAGNVVRTENINERIVKFSNTTAIYSIKNEPIEKRIAAAIVLAASHNDLLALISFFERSCFLKNISNILGRLNPNENAAIKNIINTAIAVSFEKKNDAAFADASKKAIIIQIAINVTSLKIHAIAFFSKTYLHKNKIARGKQTPFYERLFFPRVLIF